MTKGPKLCVEVGVDGIERTRSTSVRAEDDGLFTWYCKEFLSLSQPLPLLPPCFWTCCPLGLTRSFPWVLLTLQLKSGIASSKKPSWTAAPPLGWWAVFHTCSWAPPAVSASCVCVSFAAGGLGSQWAWSAVPAQSRCSIDTRGMNTRIKRGAGRGRSLQWCWCFKCGCLRGSLSLLLNFYECSTRKLCVCVCVYVWGYMCMYFFYKKSKDLTMPMKWMIIS